MCFQAIQQYSKRTCASQLFNSTQKEHIEQKEEEQELSLEQRK